MRTTVTINDDLLAAAKAAARRRGHSLGQLLEDALRRELAGPSAEATPEVPIFRGGTGPRPGVDLRSNRALSELLDPAGGEPEEAESRR
jgi:hypothetical protein